ncbi:hypothetical protein [Sphingorhabdus sp. Alg239-R122]|uniref:hypothetical protein n=1 Tax=Sphingorhabdus sp. Alg239-R122 TaxID=2305989 RepID=UPI0013DA0B95|nr:hypothetical protein [Sphingorhabdus sp. Alg239-R122]
MLTISPHGHARAGTLALVVAVALGPLSAQEQPPEFDCNRLNNSIAEIFTGIAAAQPVTAHNAQFKKGAVLLTDQRALQYRKFRLSDDTIAAAPKKKNPTVFREYMVGAEIHMCTPEKRTDLTGEPKGRYRMNCLVDADDDGKYEAIVPTGQIVRYNRITGKNVGYPYPPHPARTLPAPVTAIEDDSLAVPNPGLQPHVNIQYSAAALDGDAAAIRIDAAISMLPKESRFEGWADSETIPVALTGTDAQQVRAISLTLSKSGKKWLMDVSSAQRTRVTLQCDGTVIALPQSYTILYPKGQAVLKRQ